MKRIILNLSVFLFVGLIFNSTAFAFNATPEQIKIDLGKTQSLKIYADVDEALGEANSVSINLTLENLEVVDFGVSDSLLSIPTCESETPFTKTTVCVDVASSSVITDGQLLAELIVKKMNESEGRVIATENSQYSTGQKVQKIISIIEGENSASDEKIDYRIVGINPGFFVAAGILFGAAALAYFIVILRKQQANES